MIFFNNNKQIFAFFTKNTAFLNNNFKFAKYMGM